MEAYGTGTATDLSLAAIVLCGGKSSRMGQSKAMLPFGHETLLQRVTRILGEVTRSIVVVVAADQVLPSLPSGTHVVVDRMPEQGPLVALATGLAALPSEIDAAYTTSCDAPFLSPEFVTAIAARLHSAAIAVPCDKQFAHPLAAVYRREVHSTAERLLGQGERRIRSLFDHVPTHRIDAGDLRVVDAQLLSLINLNQPSDYVRALRRAQLPIPEWAAAGWNQDAEETD